MEEPPLDGVKLIKGNYYKGNETRREQSPLRRGKKRKKTIVFDLDETIGHFKHLKILHQCINIVQPISSTSSEFNVLLDLYPEFVRPGIMSIFELLAVKKRCGELCKLSIYTNNQHNGDWVHMIVNYIETKVKCRGLFDDIIKAFKQNNKVIEMRRTTRSKTYTDYISCLMLPEDTVETCFIDDKLFEKMCGDKVYYILPKPYYHRMSKAAMIRRILSPASPFKYYPELENILQDTLVENAHKGALQLEDEIVVTKRIMYLVREYLYYPKLPSIHKTRRKTGDKGTDVKGTDTKGTDTKGTRKLKKE